jgi:hypothetical protein
MKPKPMMKKQEAVSQPSVDKQNAKPTEDGNEQAVNGDQTAQGDAQKVVKKDGSEEKELSKEDSKEEDKPTVKQREERHINKTRTMRPKEKWEWAFGKIMNTIEVRVVIAPLHI